MQLTLNDALQPTVEVLEGTPMRPRVWRVSYPDGRRSLVRVTPNPDKVRLTNEQGSWLESLWNVPHPPMQVTN